MRRQTADTEIERAERKIESQETDVAAAIDRGQSVPDAQVSRLSGTLVDYSEDSSATDTAYNIP